MQNLTLAAFPGSLFYFAAKNSFQSAQHLKLLKKLTGDWTLVLAANIIFNTITSHTYRDAVHKYQSKGVEVNYNTDRPKYMQHAIPDIQNLPVGSMLDRI